MMVSEEKSLLLAKQHEQKQTIIKNLSESRKQKEFSKIKCWLIS
jgi:hypothetical protein